MAVKAKIDMKVVLAHWPELPKYWMTLLRSCIIGMLDGHHARRPDAGIVHELRHRQTRLASNRTQFRQGRNGRRGLA
jgi:hypothetical protein